MATTLLSAGSVLTLVQNQVYALPARMCRVRATGAIESSPDGDVSNFAAVTLSNNEADLGSGFLRTTAIGVILSIKTH